MTDQQIEDPRRRDGVTDGGAGAVEVVRHEERLRVATETVDLERVRLERFIVTEQRTFTVDVRREEVRMVREPVEPTTRQAVSPDGPSDQDEPYVMVLSEEQVVFTTEIVPVERVWLRKRLVTEEQHVTAEVRGERVDLDTTR